MRSHGGRRAAKRLSGPGLQPRRDCPRFGGHLFARLWCWAEGLFMPKAPPPYLPEFREEAVRLYRSSGKSISQVAADLGVAHETLRSWLSSGPIL